MRGVEPIRRSVTVSLPVERAFELFTSGMTTWWPVETHSRAAMEFEDEDVKVESIEFNGYPGGSIVERMSDGRSVLWGEVVEWDPPGRFVMAWKPHSRLQAPTEVEVRFTPRGSGTLVDLEHRGWERLTEDFTRLYASYGSGWIGTLTRFAEAADKEVA
jgi:uncharacterized protein YndB with AHSA1/START domain